jgi:dynein heavy chain
VLKSFGQVIESLEEDLLQLQTLLSARHVAPFRDDVQKYNSLLSDTAETLEQWASFILLCLPFGSKKFEFSLIFGV